MQGASYEFDELATSFAVQAKVTHEASNPSDTVVMTLGCQFSLNPGRSIAPLMLMVDVLNKRFEMFVLHLSR